MALPPGRSLSVQEGLFQRRLVVVSLISIGFVYLLCFWPLALGRHFLYADLGNFHLPLRMFYAEGLRDGYIPLWLPNLFCGFFLHAEGQVGMFHPVHLVLYRVLPLGVAFALECTLAFPFALLGMTLFLRRLVPPAAAICGGAAFGFSTFLLVRYTHINTVAVLAHVPWLLLLVDLVFRTRRARIRRNCLIGIALLIASQELLGYPGAIVFSQVCVTLYVIFLFCETRDLRPIAWLLVAGVAGILIGAVQWLPTFDLFAASNRADTPLDVRFAQSLHPWNLLQPLAPYLFHQRVFQVETPNPVEQSFYLGAAFPIALTWLVARWRELGRSRALLVALAFVSGFAILFALGRYGGVLQYVSLLPWVGQLRVPARFAVFFHVAAAIAIALAFADLLAASRAPDAAARRRARWIWLAPAASFAIALGALALAASSFAPSGSGRSLAGAGAIWLGPALSLACASIWFAAARGRRATLAFLVLFIAADQAYYATSIWWTVPPVSIDEFVASVPRLTDRPGGRVAMGFSVASRVDRDGNVYFDTSTRYIVHGDRLVWGYAGLTPKRRIRPYSSEVLEVAGTSVMHDQGYRVTVENPLPRFRLVTRVHVGSDPPRDIAGINVRTTVLAEHPVTVEPGPAGRVRLLEERSGAIQLAVSAPTRQFLVVSESYHPGWQLTIDGESRPVVRVYGDFMGTPIDPGEHVVALDFRPQSVAIGRAISLVGLLLLAGVAWAAGRPRAATNSAASRC